MIKVVLQWIKLALRQLTFRFERRSSEFTTVRPMVMDGLLRSSFSHIVVNSPFFSRFHLAHAAAYVRLPFLASASAHTAITAQTTSTRQTWAHCSCIFRSSAPAAFTRLNGDEFLRIAIGAPNSSISRSYAGLRSFPSLLYSLELLP